jgi:hypothetical protein
MDDCHFEKHFAKYGSSFSHFAKIQSTRIPNTVHHEENHIGNREGCKPKAARQEGINHAGLDDRNTG